MQLLFLGFCDDNRETNGLYLVLFFAFFSHILDKMLDFYLFKILNINDLVFFG